MSDLAKRLLDKRKRTVITFLVKLIKVVEECIRYTYVFKLFELYGDERKSDHRQGYKQVLTFNTKIIILFYLVK